VRGLQLDYKEEQTTFPFMKFSRQADEENYQVHLLIRKVS